MLVSGFVLRKDHHLQIAMHNQLPVEVWLHGQLFDYGGPIGSISEDAVMINDAKYLRMNFIFKIR